MKGRFTPEQGALIQKALEKVMDEQFAEHADEHPDVAAATPRGGNCWNSMIGKTSETAFQPFAKMVQTASVGHGPSGFGEELNVQTPVKFARVTAGY